MEQLKSGNLPINELVVKTNVDKVWNENFNAGSYR